MAFGSRSIRSAPQGAYRAHQNCSIMFRKKENNLKIFIPELFLTNCNTDIQNVTLDLLNALRNISTTRIPPSRTIHGTLQNDLLKLIAAAASETFDFSRVISLLDAVFVSRIKTSGKVSITQSPNPLLERSPPLSNKLHGYMSIARVLTGL